MAKTLDINIIVNSADSTVSTTFAGSTTTVIQLTKTGFVVDDINTITPTIAKNVTKTLTPTILTTSTATLWQYMAVFTYNSAEPTPYVTLVVDGVTVLAGLTSSNAFDTSLTINTSALANAVACQITFFPVY